LLTRPLVVFAICALAGGLSGAPDASAQSGRAEVSEAFGAYLDAVHARDWRAASEFMGSEVVERLDEVRTAALYADKASLLAGRFWIASSALMLRMVATAEELEKADGRDVFAMTGSFFSMKPDVAPRLSLADIEVALDGKSAIATMQLDMQPTPFDTRFVLEDGKWRIAWTPLMQGTVDGLEASLGFTPDTKPEEKEIVITRDMMPSLAERAGRPVRADIWQPLRRRN
jgi:hypothetical protein